MFKKLNNIGDCGIVCDFGDEVNKSINTNVIKLFHHIRKEVLKGNLDGVLNYTPSYNKLIINFCIYSLKAIGNVERTISNPLTSNFSQGVPPSLIIH